MTPWSGVDQILGFMLRVDLPREVDSTWVYEMRRVTPSSSGSVRWWQVSTFSVVGALSTFEQRGVVEIPWTGVPIRLSLGLEGDLAADKQILSGGMCTMYHRNAIRGCVRANAWCLNLECGPGCDQKHDREQGGIGRLFVSIMFPTGRVHRFSSLIRPSWHLVVVSPPFQSQASGRSKRSQVPCPDEHLHTSFRRSKPDSSGSFS